MSRLTLFTSSFRARCSCGIRRPKARPTGRLTLYTSQPDADAQKTVAAFQALYPDVDVTIFRSGTEEVISRFLLEAEAGRRKPMCLLVADAPTFEILKARRDAGVVPLTLRGRYRSRLTTIPDYTVLRHQDHGHRHRVQHRPRPAAGKLERSHVAARRDKWRCPIPTTRARPLTTSVFSHGADGIGWEWYDALAAGRVLLTQGNGAVLRAVASGERPYGIIVEYLAIRGKQEGSPIDIVYPKEGVPVITEPVGIVKSTQNLEAAQALSISSSRARGNSWPPRWGTCRFEPMSTPPAGFPSLSEIESSPSRPRCSSSSERRTKSALTSCLESASKTPRLTTGAGPPRIGAARRLMCVMPGAT